MQLTPLQIDALKELINIGIGRAVGSLNQMLQTPIKLRVPDLKLVTAKELLGEMGEEGHQTLSTVQLPFKGSISGSATLTFPTESAGKLVPAIMGQDYDRADLDSLKIAVLTEIGNIVLNGVMGSLTNILGQQIQYVVPSYSEISIENMVGSTSSDTAPYFLWAQASFVIEGLQVGGDIILMLGLDSLETLVQAVNAYMAPVTI